MTNGKKHIVEGVGIAMFIAVSTAVTMADAVEVLSSNRQIQILTGSSGQGISQSQTGVWNTSVSNEPNGYVATPGTFVTLNSTLDSTGLSTSGQQQAFIFGFNPPATAELNVTASFVINQPVNYHFTSTLSRLSDSTLCYYEFSLTKGDQAIFAQGQASQYSFLSTPVSIDLSGQLSPGTYNFSGYVGSKIFGSRISWVDEQTSLVFESAVPEPSTLVLLLPAIGLGVAVRRRRLGVR